jgi:hypothetical protein
LAHTSLQDTASRVHVLGRRNVMANRKCVWPAEQLRSR